MDTVKGTTGKVFGLILVCLVPTLLIYKGLGELVTAAQLSGDILGYTINFGGPIAFYAFLILVFRNWATREPEQNRHISEVDQEEIDQMSEDEKTRRLHEIDAEIEILQRKRQLLGAQPPAVGVPAIEPVTEFQVDAANIQGL